MNTAQDHPDIDKLPLEINGITVRETVREIFNKPENGTPDNISKSGCLALALKSNEVGGREEGYVLWNAWRNQFPVRQDQAGRLQNRAQFFGHDFASSPINFSRFQFGDSADFVGTYWGPFANLCGAQFGAGAYFACSRWENCAMLNGTQWGEGADFFGAQWEKRACFRGAKWGRGARFEGAQWGEEAEFYGAQFGDKANFRGLDWEQLRFWYRDRFHSAKTWAQDRGLSPLVFQSVYFSGAQFLGEVDFSNRQFKSKTHFSLLPDRFKNGLLKCGETEAVIFAEAPIFHGCDFHQDTSFEGALFPPAKGTEEAARAYRTLKLAFSKQQAIREEQRFFRLEMEEETLRETGLKRWLFRAYKNFSDYGFSITRPIKYGLLLILALTLVYGLLSWAGQCGLSVGEECTFTPRWIEFSLLQSLPLPGLDKLSKAAKTEFWPEGAWWHLGLSALVIVHKTLSLAALFLIGLALRNLFRLK